MQYFELRTNHRPGLLFHKSARTLTNVQSQGLRLRIDDHYLLLRSFMSVYAAGDLDATETAAMTSTLSQ